MLWEASFLYVRYRTLSGDRPGVGAAPMVEPRRPKQVSPYAQACLQALTEGGLGRNLSLGGAFGLAHYYEYRTTHDVDAWWVEPVTGEVRQAIVATLEEALRPFGRVRTRTWGDVVSVELISNNKTFFSFQIARRSAELQAPTVGVWPGGIAVDSLPDLVAGKMTALVERGAPRDFRDIYTLCQAGVVSIARCWEWWEERQLLANENASRSRAKLALLSHLARLEQARPLDKIEDAVQRAEAERVRTWFSEEFLRDVSD
ncbi:MAG: nucleotidyl transferase AbiEii/AbiGii toxin family protein [Anaerolineales bacterium]|nr:nucleotidyl transferase AbiEii/AbiGii toxin family protein [Anaerolineales bacterium]